MATEKRDQLIDRLDRSFHAMPRWAQGACLHAMAVPTINPATLAPFATFREMLESAPDENLEILADDFEGNGDLLPAEEVS
ncbi:hypothetical protein [Vreelandella maris]|uniref:Uncharacterized protein n=1 Tax=Vreelandella maris TaxID=2729617 RepID=A0A7Y6VAG1_9GAMM|nr:hypothetical protein [Halomonas maris]NVF15972.1 hypothetical protein [Halomonas maris]